MKKVLILANSSSGLYDFRNDLVSTLLTEYEVVASLPDDMKTQPLSDEGVRIIHTDINRRGVNPKEDYKLYREYKNLIKTEKPDVILTYTIKPNIYGGYAARKLRVPYISTITGLGSAFQKEGIFKKMIVTMYKSAFKKAACVFFQNSENMLVFEECGITRKGIKTKLVNGSGVDFSMHRVIEYPDEKDGIQLLYMGRNMKEKGTDELLETAKYFTQNKDKYENKVEFKLLGYSDENYDEIIKDYESKGYLVTHPFDTDVNKHLRDCSAVILPTYHEGMSNVLQEAAASGRAVIASNIPGCREVFEDGVTGFGCEPKSTDSLIKAVEKYISLTKEERAKMGLKGRAKVEKEFDRKMITKAYYEEIHEALK